MKKTRISITHQVEKTQHHFMVVDPDKLTSSEVERIKKVMGVEMVFINRRFISKYLTNCVSVKKIYF